MAHKKSIGLLGMLLSSCTTEVPMKDLMEEIDRETSPPVKIEPFGFMKAPPDNCYESEIPGYEQAMKEYQTKFSLPEIWTQWMNDHFTRYCRAFNIGNFYRGEYQNKIFLSLNYYNDEPIDYAEPYPEEEHEQDFERLIELTFPGYDIIAEFGRVPALSHGIVYLNAPDPGANFREIYLHNEPIVNHEFGHFLGLSHHYDTIEEASEGTNMPPGEEKCVMDKSSNLYGSSDRAALNIDLEIENGAEIYELMNKILSKYPEDF